MTKKEQAIYDGMVKKLFRTKGEFLSDGTTSETSYVYVKKMDLVRVLNQTTNKLLKLTKKSK